MDISACGKDCLICRLYKIDCDGCYHTRKEIPIIIEEGMCSIYKCVIESNVERTCANCLKMPCALIMNSIDPELTKEENKIEIENQINRLIRKQKNIREIIRINNLLSRY